MTHAAKNYRVLYPLRLFAAYSRLFHHQLVKFRGRAQRREFLVLH
jgi:hypothetical protein